MATVQYWVSPDGPSKMPVRPLRPTDMVGLALFHRRAGGTEIAAHTWPRVDPESGRIPYLSLVSAALARRPGGERAWLAEGESGTAGFAVARPRAGGLVWDLLHLHAASDADQAAVELAERAIAHAGNHRARRVFFETPSGTRGDLVARRAGFEHFTCTGLYALAPGFEVRKTDTFEARPRLRADEQALFQLYNAAVPAPVRAAEALTLEEWQALYPGQRFWQPSLAGARQQFVWELGTSIVGWMEVVFGQRSQYLNVLVHPRYEDATDKLLRYALLQVSPKVPVYLSVREYQVALGSAAEREGFRLVEEHELYVKLLAARVREPRLVPANVVGG